MSPDSDRREPAGLSSADREALDRLMERGWEPDPGDEREQAVLEAVRRLDAMSVPESDASLVDATLARVAAAERDRDRRMHVDARPVRMRRWSDVAGVAAAMLLTVGVAWPVIGHVRATAMQQGCANNLRGLATGLISYAQDHRGRLPLTPGAASMLEGRTASPDWHTYDHMGNMVALVRMGFCSARHLHCPACAQSTPHRHFAFRMPAADRPFTLTMVGSGPLLSDAKPAIEARRTGVPVGPGCVSPNHGLRGQNVLFGDGSLLWMTVPEVGGDNIFLIQGVSRPEMLPMRIQLPVGGDVLLAQ